MITFWDVLPYAAVIFAFVGLFAVGEVIRLRAEWRARARMQPDAYINDHDGTEYRWDARRQQWVLRHVETTWDFT